MSRRPLKRKKQKQQAAPQADEPLVAWDNEAIVQRLERIDTNYQTVDQLLSRLEQVLLPSDSTSSKKSPPSRGAESSNGPGKPR